MASRFDMGVVEDYVEGDALVLRFDVVDEDGNNIGIGGIEIEWEVRDTRYSDVLLSTEDDGVTTQIVDEDEGVFEVEIETAASESVRGSHVHIVRLLDADGNQTSFIGRFVIGGVGPKP